MEDYTDYPFIKTTETTESFEVDATRFEHWKKDFLSGSFLFPEDHRKLLESKKEIFAGTAVPLSECNLVDEEKKPSGEGVVFVAQSFVKDFRLLSECQEPISRALIDLDQKDSSIELRHFDNQPSFCFFIKQTLKVFCIKEGGKICVSHVGISAAAAEFLRQVGTPERPRYYPPHFSEISASQAASILGISDDLMKKLFDDGEIPYSLRFDNNANIVMHKLSPLSQYTCHIGDLRHYVETNCKSPETVLDSIDKYCDMIREQVESYQAESRVPWFSKYQAEKDLNRLKEKIIKLETKGSKAEGKQLEEFVQNLVQFACDKIKSENRIKKDDVKTEYYQKVSSELPDKYFEAFWKAFPADLKYSSGKPSKK